MESPYDMLHESDDTLVAGTSAPTPVAAPGPSSPYAMLYEEPASQPGIQDKAKIANDALDAARTSAGNVPLDKSQVRDVLSGLDVDTRQAYFDHKLASGSENSHDDWDFSEGASTDIVKSALSTMSQSVIGGVKGAVRYFEGGLPTDEELDTKYKGQLGIEAVKTVRDKVKGFGDFLNTWREEVPKGLGVEEGTVPTQVGEFAGGLAPYFVALPAAIVAHVGGSYGDTYDSSGGNKLQAAGSAALAGVTDLAFMELAKYTSGIGKGVENPVARWAARLSAGTAGNVSFQQLTKAGAAFINAAPGERYNDFKTALSEVTPKDVGIQLAFAALATKHAETARAAGKAKIEAEADATKLEATGSPETAKAIVETTEKMTEQLEVAPPEPGTPAAQANELLAHTGTVDAINKSQMSDAKKAAAIAALGGAPKVETPAAVTPEPVLAPLQEARQAEAAAKESGDPERIASAVSRREDIEAQRGVDQQALLKETDSAAQALEVAQQSGDPERIASAMARNEAAQAAVVTTKAGTPRLKPAPPSPHDFVPALRDGSGNVISGNKGETHADIKARQPEAWRDENVLADLESKGAEQGFTDKTGKFHSREEASVALKEPEPLQSERLRDMQGKAEATSNVGHNVGDTPTHTPEVIKAAYEKIPGVKVTKQSVHRSGTEDTPVVTTNRALTKEELHQLSESLKQDAIAQNTPEGGMLEGPRKENFGGEFNGEYFLDHEGKPLVKSKSEEIKESAVEKPIAEAPVEKPAEAGSEAARSEADQRLVAELEAAPGRNENIPFEIDRATKAPVGIDSRNPDRVLVNPDIFAREIDHIVNDRGYSREQAVQWMLNHEYAHIGHLLSADPAAIIARGKDLQTSKAGRDLARRYLPLKPTEVEIDAWLGAGLTGKELTRAQYRIGAERVADIATMLKDGRASGDYKMARDPGIRADMQDFLRRQIRRLQAVWEITKDSKLRKEITDLYGELKKIRETPSSADVSDFGAIEAPRVTKKEIVEEGLTVADIDALPISEAMKAKMKSNLPKTAIAEPVRPATSPGAPAAAMTGTSHEAVAAERAARDMTPVHNEASRDFGSAWVKSDEVLKQDKGAGRRLASEMILRPKALNDIENATLLRHQIEVQNEHQAALDAYNTNPGDVVAKRRLEDARADSVVAYDAADIAGTETGRGLNARKMLAANDFSLNRMETTYRAEVNDGKALTGEQVAKVERINKRIEKAQGDIEKYETGQSEPLSVEQLRKASSSKLKGLSTARLVATRESLDAQIASLTPAKKLAAPSAERLAAPTSTAEQLSELVALRDQLKVIEEQRANRGLEGDKKRIRGRIENLRERIAARDFSPTEKKAPRMDVEKVELLFEYQKAKDEFHEALFNDRIARSKKEKGIYYLKEAGNFARAAKTSFDLSAVFRQGGFIGLAHPIRAARNIGEMLRAFKSEKEQFRIIEELRNRPNAKLYKQAGLFLAIDTPGASLVKAEEVFASRLAKKVPGVAGSERAYTTFLNLLRADSFDVMTRNLARDGKATTAELKGIANYINVATGRGDVGKLAGAAAGLNQVFFAPRYVVSRFQLLTLQPIRKGMLKGEVSSDRVRTQVAAEYARALGGLAVVLGLGAAAGGQIETDSRSSDFLKIRFGDTRLDPLMGLAQPTVFLSRLATKKIKSGGGDSFKDVDSGKFGSTSSGDLLLNFGRSKIAPIPSAIWNSIEGKDVTGQKASVLTEARDLYIPLSTMDIYKAMREQGVPRGAALGMISLFGMSLQTYSPRAPKRTHTGRGDFSR